MNNMEIIKTSVSQMEDAKGCFRRWWFKSVQNLPTPKKAVQIYGDVAHAVIDRYMLADDRGIDPTTGRPMDLYPPGWHRMKNRFDKTETEYEITPTEQAQIKYLIQTAIENGILVREPGREPEQPFKLQLALPGIEDVICEINGYKDLVFGNCVLDHKFMKATKWCLSKTKMVEDIQMMLYGLDHHLKNPYLSEIRIGQNQFIKDRTKPIVQQRIIGVTPHELLAFYNQVAAPLLYEMVRYKRAMPKGNAIYFNQVKGPVDPKECNYHYGKPCPYLNICTGSCTPERYVQIQQTISKRTSIVGVPPMPNLLQTIGQEQPGQPPQPVPTPAQPGRAPAMGPIPQYQQPGMPQPAPGIQGGLQPPQQPQPYAPPPAVPAPAMGPFPLYELSGLPQPAAPSPAQTPQYAPPPVVPVPSTPPAAPVATQPAQSAPWYSPDCEICRHTGLQGYNPQGEPCRVCQIKSGLTVQPAAVNTNGTVTYQGPAGSVSGPAPAPAQIRQQQQPAAPVPVSQSERAILTAGDYLLLKELTKNREQPADLPVPGHYDFTLLLGAVVALERGAPANKYDAQDIFKNMMDQHNQNTGIPIETTDHFKSLPIVDSWVPPILEALKGSIVTAHPSVRGSLYNRFVETLRMYASTIIVAIQD